MKKEPVIILKNITKKYYLERPQTLKKLLKNLFHPFEKFTVIKNFSLTVNKGEFILLTGPNGSGKTTLLKLIAGIIKPDSGEIKTYGRIVPLIELGAGFNFELTGRENILINATILGLSKKEIKDKMNAIISFSELGRFIDIPLKRYSTGMISRLAFSIAAFSNPDILLLDEVFAVGDINFRQKTSTVLSQFKKQKKTIILTTNFPLGLKIFDREVLLDINSSKININKKTFPINFLRDLPIGFVFNAKVSSPSMEPTLKVGEIVKIKRVNIDLIRKNDIILFFEKHYQYPIIHRLVKIIYEKNQKKLITKGDNVKFRDQYFITGKELIGKIVK